MNKFIRQNFARATSFKTLISRLFYRRFIRYNLYGHCEMMEAKES